MADAMNALIDVYVNGFVTGIASAVKTLGGDDEQADGLAQYLAEGVRTDPLVMNQIVEEIDETLAGVDTGPKSIHLTGP